MIPRFSRPSGTTGAAICAFALMLSSVAHAGKKAPASNEPPYYPNGATPMFIPFPDNSDKGAWKVKNFGPVGIGIDLVRPGMTMKIHNVEPGSPASTAGKLAAGQTIESINGKVLKDIDPRVFLGDIITQAEATDGKITLKIQGAGDVLVKIPVMGAYSKTWPLNCPKSDKIVRNLADILAKQEKPAWGSVMFLLSTGEEKDLAVVRKWMKGIKTIGGLNWDKGCDGPGLCEYYLRTGDATVLPVIKQMTDELKVNMYNGGWSGRGAPAAFTYSTGTGQLHAAGVHCMTFLLMAKLCGVEVDEYMFSETFKQFYRFAGHGNVAYGNGLPEGGFRDNGKTAGLAMAMAAAAMVAPTGEQSVYAKARDNSAMKSFYATNWFHAAHTGGGIGEIWHHQAMSLVSEKRPNAYRTYLDTRRWVMDLSRRFDGSIGIAGMEDRYDASFLEDTHGWGTLFALTYTLPRKQLQLFGAPRSKWAKTAQMLDRPWGTPADDCFQSPDPIPGGKLTMEDLKNEKVETDSSSAVFKKLADPNLSTEALLKYIYHPEYDLRSSAMDQVVKRGKVELIVPLMKSSDPRLRQAGLLALTGMFKGSPLSADQVTPEMKDLACKMLEDPNESWWGSLHAIEAVGRMEPALIAKHQKRLLQFLNYDCVWIQTAAVCTLAKIAASPEHYKVVLPAIAKKASEFTIDSSSGRSTKAIADAMKSASPEVKTFAIPLMKSTYTAMPDVLKDPYTGAVMERGAKTVRSRVASIMQELPGGEDFVRRVPKTTLASYISGKDSDMYVYNGTFVPNKSVLGKWAWAVYPSPTNPKEIEPRIKTWLNANKSKPSGKMEKSKDILELLDGGKVAKSKYFSGYFWSGDTLIGSSDGQALKMQVKTVDGVEFLVVEKGGFDTTPDSDEVKTISKDYHCGFHIYVREP